MKRTLLIFAASFFLLFACNPAQEQQTEETVDSLQQEMEAEMDTAANKLDSLGDTLKDATDSFLDEAGQTLEEAGKSLKDSGN